MIKCKDCKVFSPQSECGGICGFSNFGTVKNDDGCHTGTIINDIYEKGRTDMLKEIENCDGRSFLTTDQVHDLCTEAQKKGRQDAIDECVKFVDEWDSVIANALAKNSKGVMVIK